MKNTLKGFSYIYITPKRKYGSVDGNGYATTPTNGKTWLSPIHAKDELGNGVTTTNYAIIAV